MRRSRVKWLKDLRDKDDWGDNMCLSRPNRDTSQGAITDWALGGCTYKNIQAQGDHYNKEQRMTVLVDGGTEI